MQLDTLVRLTPIVPVLGVFLVVTGLWAPPEREAAAPGVGTGGRPSILLQIDVAPPTGRFTWEPETLGLLAAFLEGGVSSMHAVTAQIDDTPIAEGLEVATTPEVWTATFRLDGAQEALEAEMLLCSPKRKCTPLVVTGRYQEPEAIARQLVLEIGRRIDRDPQLATAWTRRQSKDLYAQLIAGRSAATWYGWVEPVGERQKGDVIRDPIARAPWLDPHGPIAQWMAARRYLAEQNDLSAELALRRAADKSPGSLLDVLHATVLMRSGAPDEAAVKLAALPGSFADDPRMTFNEIEALLVSGNPGEATRRLDALAEGFQDAPRALQLRVAIERSEGKVPSPDGLLQRWQDVAPYDPEPVRLRIDALVQAGRFEEALELAPELDRRGRGQEARTLELALAAQLEDWSRAAKAAARIDAGLADAIRRLGEDGSAGRGAGEDDALFGALVKLDRADAELAQGRHTAALDIVREVLEDDPDNVDALLLQVEAWSQAGDADAVQRARCALHRVHPGALGAPGSSEMLSLSRRCANR